MRYFTITTLVAFAAVALALYLLQGMEEAFFTETQDEQGAFFAQAQAELARQHEDAARRSLLAVHEASHVNLTRLVANLLWDTDFGPFVAAAQRVSIDACRALPPAPSAAASATALAPRRACFAEAGRQIRSLPAFRALDAKAYAAMRASTVFKIKVFDLRGVVVYSSESGQIGDDGAGNQGWKSAASGQPASELTHRDRFSAFEGVVENRDLISTYVPVRAAGSDQVIGVFEIYSDVTPFLDQIKAAAQTFSALTEANQVKVARTAQANSEKVSDSSEQFLLIVGGLLGLLYAASLLIVRNGQRIIDRQTLAQEQSMRRELLWHQEKMTALATMAANVSHEVGNPLAVISGLAQQLAAREVPDETIAGPARQILEQASRIARMTRQISDFATAHRETPEWVDVNAMVKAVCDFLAFDLRFRARPIEFQPGEQLPARVLVPDHLNEVLMNLLQAYAEGIADGCLCGQIRVETKTAGDNVEIRVGCCALPAEAAAPPTRILSGARFEAVRRRLLDMGGQIVATERTVTLTLPPPVAQAQPV